MDQFETKAWWQKPIVWVSIVVLLAAGYAMYRGQQENVFLNVPVYTNTLEGAITSIDAEALFLRVQSPSYALERTIAINSETRIYRSFTPKGVEKEVVEVNLTDLGVGEDVEITYSNVVDPLIATVISVSDARSFDEYRATTKMPALLHATLVQAGEQAIEVRLVVEGESRTLTFPLTTDTPVWRIADVNRAHIIHAREQVSFPELVAGREIVLELDGQNVSSIIISSKTN